VLQIETASIAARGQTLTGWVSCVERIAAIKVYAEVRNECARLPFVSTTTQTRTVGEGYADSNHPRPARSRLFSGRLTLAPIRSTRRPPRLGLSRHPGN
jgi:hypothetical protein